MMRLAGAAGNGWLLMVNRRRSLVVGRWQPRWRRTNGPDQRPPTKVQR
jgi:hypothetical protein